MRVLKWVILGIAIWGLGLLWPEVNQIRGWPVIVGLVLGLGATILVHILDKATTTGHKGDDTRQPSRPVPVAIIR
jgi:F0F1-type ATP synthase assembly protein I